MQLPIVYSVCDLPLLLLLPPTLAGVYIQELTKVFISSFLSRFSPTNSASISLIFCEYHQNSLVHEAGLPTHTLTYSNKGGGDRMT